MKQQIKSRVREPIISVGKNKTRRVVVSCGMILCSADD